MTKQKIFHFLVGCGQILVSKQASIVLVLSKLICSAVQHRHHFAGKHFTIFLEIWLKKNRGHFGENIASRVVVCVASLQINFESTIAYCTASYFVLVCLHHRAIERLDSNQQHIW